ncbi:GntR family transcriptional regulator [Mycolicibacterium frederiksbergense]|uniref:GntR family transcriptional regulator n=1 Tax=Mycolicibacterium frederiksbergense TaxID=117567 RepID=UPI00265C02AC|nr:GntR family transcriptional regulator [Mycolicibacterium frederiksbergense]MDO0978144.1 GntR family transcriptional regulator [Mycolicibacterium frederiksbergense]
MTKATRTTKATKANKVTKAKATSYIGPLVQKSTPSIIADKLRAAIGHGELKPGEQLGEADLARQLGVSRGPLREGMQRLTQEGLLVAIRNRGLFVVELTPEDLQDMYVAREATERAAARKIFDDGGHVAAGDALLEIVDQMGLAITSAEASELDIAFHEQLVALSGSPRLARMHQTFITETRMCIHALAESYAKSDYREHEHRTLAAALRSGDRDLTDSLLMEHMDDALARLIDAPAVEGAEPVSI